MVRIILGAIVGFLVWTFILRLTDFLGMTFSTDWYGKNQADLIAAINNKTPYFYDSTLLFLFGIRSAILTIISAFVAVVVSKEQLKTSILLGILLTAVGLFVHSIIWNLVPMWYNALILLPLIPLAIFGGKLRKV
jgi:hypothetical protein